jgi:DNA-binding CsgD family transcriptional regulator
LAELIDPAVLSELVAGIYDCAVEPDLWPDLLDRFRTEVRFHNASLALTLVPSGRFLVNITSGMPTEYTARMYDYPDDLVELWGGAATMLSLPFDRPSVRSRVGSADVLANNRYIREWVEPQGLIDAAVMILAHDNDAIGNLAMGRHRDQGPIGQVDIDRLSLFIPHFQRATRISRLLDAGSLATRGFETIVGQLATPVLLLTDDLSIAHCNIAADRLLEEGTMLSARAGRLAARNDTAQRALVDLVRQASTDESGLRRGSIGLNGGGTDNGVAAVYALPLRRGHVRSTIHPGASVALFVAAANVPANRVSEVAMDMFGLTMAEYRVMNQLAKGQSITTAARTLGIAQSTVRTHVLRLFDKTGTRRQADLVSLTAALASPIKPGAQR